VFEVILKRFDEPDEIREFEKGKFELVRIGGMTIGRATYEPGWRTATALYNERIRAVLESRFL
jgi:hypothetical protein